MHNKEKSFGLTQGQQSLWAGEKLHPESRLRNVIYTFEIEGNLNTLIFKKAFQNSLAKIEAMRTVFNEDANGEVLQSVLPSIAYDVEVLDLPAEITHDRIDSWLLDQGNIKLDISHCVFNTFLVKINENTHIWFLNIHHLVSDTISFNIVYDVTQRFYTALNESTDLNIEDTPSVEEYLTYERQQQSNCKNDISKAHWWNKAQNPNLISDLYGKQNNFNTIKSTRINWDLGATRSEELRQIAKNPKLRSFTPDLTLLNIFSTLLFAYLYKVNAQNNLAVGVTSQNRTTKSFKETFGYFIQIFPLIAELHEDDTLTTLLQRTKQNTNANLMHGKSGLATPDINRSYNVILNYINVSFPDFAGLNTTTKWLHCGYIDSSHYFHCHVTDFNGAGNFQLAFDLNEEVFNIEQRQWVQQHFMKVLDAFITDQNMKLSDIDIITKSELKKIEKWNDTTILFDKNETLLSKFEAQVNDTPDATALVFGDSSFTYKNFNEKVNQVANYLIKNEVREGDIVAISLERSLEMMVYIYGILKAGAVYLPIDTNTPSERVRFIAEDAEFKILFYNHNRIISEHLENVTCLKIEDINAEVSMFETTKPAINISPKSLAYIIYTSGSTGQPKGVKCHHKGICNRLNWMNRDYPIDKKDTFLQKTPITFDVSLPELFGPLQVGAKLVIELPEEHKNPEQLADTINRNDVSVIHFVPSMLAVFLESTHAKTCTSLRKIFCSGEALSANTVQKAYETLDSIKVYNLYGPTEAAVEVTHWSCEQNALNEGVPIGRPIANTNLYIVDKQMELVPIGVKGELCIGGVQVAHGYLNRDELTKERFVPDNFSKTSGAKLYRTGDVARYRQDGNIEYLGRLDNQIKIRGFRIELGEIEKVIEKCFDISQVAALVDNQENLMVYYTGNELDTNQAKTELLKLLPDYMIPNTFINLEELPLTKNGKINRSALKEINISSPKSVNTYVAPQGEIEELVAEIWKEVLALNQVSVHDSFIALGGHSLAAIRVTARINEEIEMKFPLNKIFELPTIAEYSKYIEKTLISLMDQKE